MKRRPGECIDCRAPSPVACRCEACAHIHRLKAREYSRATHQPRPTSTPRSCGACGEDGHYRPGCEWPRRGAWGWVEEVVRGGGRLGSVAGRRARGGKKREGKEMGHLAEICA